MHSDSLDLNLPVMHLGPFKLSKGEKQKHNIVIKNYVGSVRVMVVALQVIMHMVMLKKLYR